MARLRQQAAQGVEPPPRAALPARRRWLCGLAQAVVHPVLRPAAHRRLARAVLCLSLFHRRRRRQHSAGGGAIRSRRSCWPRSLTSRVADRRQMAYCRPVESRAAFRLWGVTYFRWWLADRFAGTARFVSAGGTPWMPLYLRALGARIGRDVMIDTVTLRCAGIADDRRRRQRRHVREHRKCAGRRRAGCILGPVHVVRARWWIPTRFWRTTPCSAGNARLCGLSALAAGRAMPDGETWDGAPGPARRTSVVEPLPPRPRSGRCSALGPGGVLCRSRPSRCPRCSSCRPSRPSCSSTGWTCTLGMCSTPSLQSACRPSGCSSCWPIPASALLVAGSRCCSPPGCCGGCLPRQTAGLVLRLTAWPIWRKKA